MTGVKGKGGYVLYPPLNDGRAVRAWKLNEPLTRYAPHLYKDCRFVNDP